MLMFPNLTEKSHLLLMSHFVGIDTILVYVPLFRNHNNSRLCHTLTEPLQLLNPTPSGSDYYVIYVEFFFLRHLDRADTILVSKTLWRNQHNSCFQDTLTELTQLFITSHRSKTLKFYLCVSLFISVIFFPLVCPNQ